jgi:hypothetical protein
LIISRFKMLLAGVLIVLAGPAMAQEFSSESDWGSLAPGCMHDFAPLRQEAERQGRLLKQASDARVPPAQACKLIHRFAQAEMRMVRFVETQAGTCEIPPRIADRLKTGHERTLELQAKVCAVAGRRSAALPDARAR